MLEVLSFAPSLLGISDHPPLHFPHFIVSYVSSSSHLFLHLCYSSSSSPSLVFASHPLSLSLSLPLSLSLSLSLSLFLSFYFFLLLSLLSLRALSRYHNINFQLAR